MACVFRRISRRLTDRPCWSGWSASASAFCVCHRICCSTRRTWLSRALGRDRRAADALLQDRGRSLRGPADRRAPPEVALPQMDEARGAPPRSWPPGGDRGSGALCSRRNARRDLPQAPIRPHPAPRGLGSAMPASIRERYGWLTTAQRRATAACDQHLRPHGVGGSRRRVAEAERRLASSDPPRSRRSSCLPVTHSGGSTAAHPRRFIAGCHVASMPQASSGRARDPAAIAVDPSIRTHTRSAVVANGAADAAVAPPN